MVELFVMKNRPIYVERFIQSPFIEVWEHTQDPSKHQQWDLRFSEIVYLPKTSPEAAQSFLYTTRIGFSFKVSGKGESIGTHNNNNGESTSALKFWSDESISLIQAGSGYWKYIPQNNGIKFLTWYDYKVRFGFLGQGIDYIFRPLLGWATALSFDCLGLWLEKGIAPKTSFDRFMIQWLVRWALALTWFYQGLVPKILFRDTGELEILRASRIFHGQESLILSMVGTGEIIIGILFLIQGQSRRIYYVNIILLIILMCGAFYSQPKIFTYPFNPLTLTLGMIALAVIGIRTMNDLPSANHCLRKQVK